MSEEKDDQWEMPKPVFRSSTGSLPKRFEDTISESFMPNADTIEIDEDEDILSIHETPLMDQAGQSKSLHDEVTLESETETDADNSEEPSIADADQKQPVVVTVKKPLETAQTHTPDSGSNLLNFVLIALIAAIIIATVLYYRS